MKARYEDFVVEEISAYEPCGEGDHVYFTMEKMGLSTQRAVRDIARALGVRPRDIGVAGMKDARGVTRQRLSLEHVDPAGVKALQIPRISILEVDRHRNKLRIGHLRGNRFVIKLRDTDVARIDDVRRALDRLVARGVPNYFGTQRFGNRGDTWQVGRALLTGSFGDAVEIVAGRPESSDSGSVLRARELFAEERYGEAAAAWPRGFNECVTVCKAMERSAGDHRRAAFSLDRKALGFYVSACQSKLFNDVLAARIESFHQVELGDVAWKHPGGAVFDVEDEAEDRPRADRFEISPTGPMFGPRMKMPKERPLAEEQRVLKEEGLSAEHFAQSGPLKCAGGRRPLRFRPESATAAAGEDDVGSYIELSFELPSGCYATALLREICKDSLVEK